MHKISSCTVCNESEYYSKARAELKTRLTKYTKRTVILVGIPAAYFPKAD